MLALSIELLKRLPECARAPTDRQDSLFCRAQAQVVSNMVVGGGGGTNQL